MRSRRLVGQDHVPTQCPACGGALRATTALDVAPADESEQLHLFGRPWRPTRLSYARCGCGSLIAIDERRAPGALEQAYASLPETYWSGLSEQAPLARRLEPVLAGLGHSAGELVDVGCGDGGLIAALHTSGHTWGIEPGAAAVARAKSRGCDVRQGSASSLALREVADVVLGIDLVEHLDAPAAELAAMAAMLKPGGHLVLLTGDAAAPAARVSGPWWYYLHVLGHVTVFSRQALRRALEQAGLRVVSQEPFDHPAAVSGRRWVQRLLGNVARVALGRRPGIAHLYRDHQLAIARKG